MAMFLLPVLLKSAPAAADGRVLAPGGVAEERLDTGGAVVVAHGVADERREAAGGVVGG